jgi:hypothetical protein
MVRRMTATLVTISKQIFAGNQQPLPGFTFSASPEHIVGLDPQGVSDDRIIG